MNKAILICDHSLDPRLRKRCNWLEKLGFEVDVFVDKKRGQHFNNNEFTEHDISELSVGSIKKFDILYVSGAKIIFNKFFYLLLCGFFLGKDKLVYEIPDLPLRSKCRLQNKLILVCFKLIVRLLFKNIVVTSPAFIQSLPKKLNYFLCENLPHEDLLSIVENSAINKSILHKDENFTNKLTIGFVGALRYERQMLFLIKYCLEYNVECIFYGGPVERISHLKDLCYEAGIILGENILFKGSFRSEDLPYIYKNIDFIYSVYDANQPNVKLALPNKLYESILFEKPIIVAKYTYLSELVEKNRIGFSVNSCDYSLFKKQMNYGLKDEFSFNAEKEHVKNKIKVIQSDFCDWITTLINA